jgi:hypothetical protein
MLNVLHLHKQLGAGEQLLCFLPSQLDVENAVKDMERYHVNAKPLYAQQREPFADWLEPELPPHSRSRPTPKPKPKPKPKPGLRHKPNK